ncbi:hypothetical protein BDB01DRAFT_837365 [Pilobolus umbonatus]|nr:hypothetical protein BDB01DRAFT_837365 [Pilobolus umbonatus]
MRLVLIFTLKYMNQRKREAVELSSRLSGLLPYIHSFLLEIVSQHVLPPLSTLTSQTLLSKSIPRLLKMSSNEANVSLRYIASSLVLQSVIPKEDIVAIGNWASSKTSEHTIVVNFSFNAILPTHISELMILMMMTWEKKLGTKDSLAWPSQGRLLMALQRVFIFDERVIVLCLTLIFSIVSHRVGLPLTAPITIRSSIVLKVAIFEGLATQFDSNSMAVDL